MDDAVRDAVDARFEEIEKFAKEESLRFWYENPGEFIDDEWEQASWQRCCEALGFPAEQQGSAELVYVNQLAEWESVNHDYPQESMQEAVRLVEDGVPPNEPTNN